MLQIGLQLGHPGVLAPISHSTVPPLPPNCGEDTVWFRRATVSPGVDGPSMSGCCCGLFPSSLRPGPEFPPDPSATCIEDSHVSAAHCSTIGNPRPTRRHPRNPGTRASRSQSE
jgi:hypothetical protein